jgi:asparagine synthase (glutamine-hydrolysing)
MCGIAGIVNLDARRPVQPGVLNAMLHAVRHRGPEVSGVYVDGPAALGHDRLSIIDLAGGLQPIGNEDESIWIVCNGEVFNYIELRQELLARGHTFRTGSDTEIILHLYEEQGPGCLESLIGQFAIAIWDSNKRTLFLARDRLGIRPLFYAQAGNSLLFASEIKALLASGLVDARLDPEVVDQVFTYWAPLPGRTAFTGIEEIPPAHYILVRDGRISLHRYWSVDFTSEPGGMALPESYYAERLLDLLVDSTRLRLRADVPVGAYLSGGLDSSTVAAIVRRYTTNSLKTFSIAFSDAQFDERIHQHRMAEELGTEHVSIECTDADIAAVFPDVVKHIEAPVLRTAPAPMYMLSGLVREHGLKVVLTGEGSDEFLGGYDIFKETMVRRFWSANPQSKLRPLLLKKLYGDVPAIGDASQAYLEAFFKNGITETNNPYYSHLVRWRSSARLKRMFSPATRAHLAACSDDALLAEGLEGFKEEWDTLSKAQFVESRTFMSQYLLSSQGDRVAMAHAVEGRFPFLDHRVVEFAATIPPHLRLKGLNEKYILKRAASDLLPAAVLARTKRPYRAPIRNAFLGPNAPDYVMDALSPAEIEKVGIFDPAAVSMLVRKCRQAPTVGESDSMALVGVLTTQLLHHFFVEQRSAIFPTVEDFPTVRVGKHALGEQYATALT